MPIEDQSCWKKCCEMIEELLIFPRKILVEIQKKQELMLELRSSFGTNSLTQKEKKQLVLFCKYLEHIPKDKFDQLFSRVLEFTRKNEGKIC